jgi:transcription antitermination factor NusA-like protein
VGEHEVEVMRALLELEEREGVNVLRKATYHKTYVVDNTYVVVLDLGIGSSVPLFTRYARSIEQKLQEKLGRRVRVVPKASDVRGLASFLLYPARVLGVNTLWLPDGSIEYVIRVSRRDQRIIGNRREEYERILTELLGQRTRIRIE